MNIFKNKNKAFTVIELLVVLAIVGLIASIVLVNLKGSREKAEIAKVLQYSGSIKNALGAYIVGDWGFDESGDNTCPAASPYNDFCDNSGSGNHGQSVNVVGREANNEIPELGKAGDFSCVDCRIEIPNSDSLNLTDKITIEAWIKADTFSSAYQGVVLKRTVGSYEMWIYGDSPRFGLRVDGSLHRRTSTYDLDTNTWYHLVYTFDGNDMKIYVNGDEKDSWSYPGPITPDNHDLYIGYSGYSTEYFNGAIDGVRIYNEALVSAQIQKLYAKGLKRILVKE